MKIKLILSVSTVVGYDNNHGYITTKTYGCPCGKGRITEEIDDVPGFKHRSVHIECPVCEEKYYIDTSNGRVDWHIVKKTHR